MKKTVLLTILDGYGIRDNIHGNAVKLAKNKIFNMLWERYPHTLLEASGEYVGLPEGQMGNSEVGHMNIGAGRIVYQALELINKDIKDGKFFSNNEILSVINHVKENNSNLHIMGLLSDGGVHSHIDHLKALVKLCKDNDVNVVYDLFLDGRDVAPKSALEYLKVIDELNYGKIATISGRYYAMDRDNNFDRLKLAYDAIVYGMGNSFSSYEELINNSYNNNITDEFIVPGIINCIPVNDNDGIITFNFRKDRLRELFTCLTNPNEYKSDASKQGLVIKDFSNLKILTFLPVVESVKCPSAYQDPNLKNLLGEYVSNCGLSQLRIAETEKYAHVTFFFDGGKEVDYQNETKILIPSPKVATYDLKPEMSAYEVTDRLIDEIGKQDLIILNYANGDMVGHTGDLEAAIKAVEALDKCLELVYNKINEVDGVMMIIADHGNCEEMLDDDNNVITSHTTNKVPCIITKDGLNLKEGKLGDVAPTLLSLLNLNIPIDMTGESIII